MRRLNVWKLLLCSVLAFWGVGALARTMTVDSVVDGVATLSFGDADGKAYTLMVARGERDFGPDRTAWPMCETIGTVAADATTRTWKAPAGEGRVVRFFLLGEDPSLPYAKRLEWIKSGSSQYIDTGVIGRTGVSVEMEVMPFDDKKDVTAIGSRKDTGNTRFFPLHFGTSDKKSEFAQASGTFDHCKMWYTTGFRYLVKAETTDGERTLEATPGWLVTRTDSATTTVNTGLNMYLFAANMYGKPNQYSNFRLYRAKIWLDGELKRDFTPCEDAGGKGALYDAVSGTIFSNKITTDFTKGPEIAKPLVVVSQSGAVEMRSAGTLIGKWDFTNFDPANPASDGILKATVGQDGIACRYSGAGSAPIGDGTLGSMQVVTTGLPAGFYGIQIPQYHHIRLPFPSGALDNCSWTLKIKFWAPTAGSKQWRPLYQRDADNTDDAELFLNQSDKIGIASYSVAVSLDQWHTLTVTGGPGRYDWMLDEGTQIRYFNSSGLDYWNGRDCLLLGADNSDAAKKLITFGSVELWREGGAASGRDRAYSRAGLTGEWTFPAENPLRAAKGFDLEYSRLSDNGGFLPLTDGVVAGDTGWRAEKGCGFRCRHGLPTNANYSVVMDVRVPNGLTETGLHGCFLAHTYRMTDCCFFLRDHETDDVLDAWVAGSTYVTTPCRRGEWIRAVLTYANEGNKTLYLNGARIDARAFGNMKIEGPYCFFVIDNNGEDNTCDISYAAIYDRVLTDAEVAELHARPTAHVEKPEAVDDVLPAVSSSGLWEWQDGAPVTLKGGDLVATENGGYTWTRDAAPSAATYVADLTLPWEQLAGGTLVANAKGVISGIYGTAGYLSGSFITSDVPSIFAPATAWTGADKWGYWTYQPVTRGEPHRLAVVWSASGRVSYYEDGVLRCQLFHATENAAATPTAVMTFFENLGATVTRLEAYDCALTPFEIAALGPAGTPLAAANTAPVATLTTETTDVRAVLDTVTFTAAFTDAEGEYAAYEIDFGDGAVEQTARFMAPGAPQVFEHIYRTAGVLQPRVRVISQNGQMSDWVNGPAISTTAVTADVRDVLQRRPWQQNVYTNRFTIMVEAVKEWQGLQLQYGDDYAHAVEMQGTLAPAGNTWIYKGRVTLDGHPGETIPYRLGFTGGALTNDDEGLSAGTVTLWSMDENESFSCSIWGDNQEGACKGDWDADPFLYVTRLFEHMLSREVDFGLTTGDMASGANYVKQIKPLILERTDGIFGCVKPYYVAWGNHDTGYPANKPYFEAPSIDDPDYGTSEVGNSYLYRGNVLFIFLDDSVRTAAATKTWLANLLATERAQAAKFRIVLHHQPIFTEVSGSMDRTLEATFIAGGVDLVLNGHMHGYERFAFSGVNYIVNGGAGYLDHPLSVRHNWGDATAVGGHLNAPFLWARQSLADPTVLGPAEPARMGMITGYGELQVKNNELVYIAHGFNADGSYIGVFDSLRLVSKTVAGLTVTEEAKPTCADASSFAEFTTKPVTNAKWKEYADAVGLAFTFAEDAGDKPVTGVSKREIDAFLAWLNGSTNTYRLPTVAELTAAFDGVFAREIAEWTSTVEPARGRCRILGGPACAVAGTWTRAADAPEMMTADCKATYLGFRLATGPVPAEPSALEAACAAAMDPSVPEGVYKWTGGQLVSIYNQWFAVNPQLTYDEPVVYTMPESDHMFASSNPLVLNGGIVFTKATKFKKDGTGALTLGGVVRVPKIEGSTNAKPTPFTIEAGGSLMLRGVRFVGTSAQFKSVDRQLVLAGENDFGEADLAFDETTVTNLVAASSDAPTLLKARTARQYKEDVNQFFGIGAGVTLQLAEDFKLAQQKYVIDGLVDVAAVNATANNGPYFLGTGTLRTGFAGVYENAYFRWGVSNVVWTSARPLRNNKASSKSAQSIDGESVTRLTSTYDWTILPRDELGIPVMFLTEAHLGEEITLQVDTPDPDDGTTAHTVTLNVSPTLAENDGNAAKWGIDKVNAGTLALGGSYSYGRPTRVLGGTLKLLDGVVFKASEIQCAAGTTLELAGAAQVPSMTFDGATLKLAEPATFTGRARGAYTLEQAADAELTLTVESCLDGAVTFAAGTEKFRLRYVFGSTTPTGEYLVLANTGLSADQVEVTTNVDTEQYRIEQIVTPAGDVKLVVLPVEAKIAVWTGNGVRTDPTDADNWVVTGTDGAEIPGATPDAATYIRLSGETTLNVPAGTSVTSAGLLLASQVTLAADCDWCGLGTVALRDQSKIDLLGHTLTLLAFGMGSGGTGEITDSTTDAEHPGEFHLAVPANTTVTNDCVLFTGNLKFVKEGEGQILSKMSCSYTGGTVIAEGKWTTFNNGSTDYSFVRYFHFGQVGSSLEIAAGATLDVFGNYDLYVYKTRLAGTLTSSAYATTNAGNGGIGWLTIDGEEAFIDVVKHTVFNGGNIELPQVDLGGHTLKMDAHGGSGNQVCLNGFGFTNGTVKVVSGGWWRPCRNPADCSTADFEMGAALWLDADITVRNFKVTYGNLNDVNGTAHVYIKGVYSVGTGYMNNFVLLDGATLDVSGQEGTWSIESTRKADQRINFADGAKIALSIGRRRLADGEKLIGWTTPPANLSSLSFVFDEAARAFYDVLVESDGIYVRRRGLMLIFR